MADGQVDTSFYKDATSENPLDMAGKVVDYRNKLLNNQQQQQQIQSNQIKLATDRFGMINNAASGLLSDPDLGSKDVTGKLWDVLGRLTKGDAMSAAHAVQFMQQFPTEPGQQVQAIKNVHSQTLDAVQRGNAYLGQTQIIPTGGGNKITNVKQYGGAPQDLGYVPNTLQPGTQQVNPDLSQSYVGGTGNPPLQGPAPNKLLPPVNNPASQATGWKAEPPVNAQTGAPLPPSFNDRFSAARPGTVMAAPKPGAAETQVSQAQEGQKSGSTLNARADSVPQRMADLNNMERELEISGGKFGPLAHSEKKANQIAQRILGFGVTMSPEEIAGIENFDKIGNQIALNQAGALGVSDQRVQTSMGANPNSDYSYLGNKGILPILKGNEDAIALKAREWKKWSKTHGADTYNDFSDQFNQDFNPQVFQFARMTKEQRAKFVAALPDKEQAIQLAKDLDAYKKKGWVKQ